MSVLDNFGNWKDFLNNRLENAEQSGVSEDSISNFAVEIGEYLSTHVDPKNEEQRVLSDLWNVADEHQKEALANVMVNLVKSSK